MRLTTCYTDNPLFERGREQGASVAKEAHRPAGPLPDDQGRPMGDGHRNRARSYHGRLCRRQPPRREDPQGDRTARGAGVSSPPPLFPLLPHPHKTINSALKCSRVVSCFITCRCRTCMCSGSKTGSTTYRTMRCLRPTSPPSSLSSRPTKYAPRPSPPPFFFFACVLCLTDRVRVMVAVAAVPPLHDLVHHRSWCTTA